MGEQALHCEMVVSSMCQPNHSYAESMSRLQWSCTWLCGCRCAAPCLPHHVPRDYPAVLFTGLWPHSFHKIMYLYSICLVSTTHTCCEATITLHKHNTNIQELPTLPNSITLLIAPRVYNREGGRVSYFTMGLCYNTLRGS